jgi:hypothetical protein
MVLTSERNPDMTKNEIDLVTKLASKEGWVEYTVSRKSDREYDLHIEGKSQRMGCGFSAWLVLAAIRELTMWTSPAVAEMTDYPNMAFEGDWSGVRDTNEDSLWMIFNKFVVK